MKRASFEEMKCAELGFAQARRVRQHGVKHGLQFAGRTRNDPQHLRGRGLLLQRLAEIAVRACTSSNSRTFSIAITAWSANVVASSICLSVNGRTVDRCNTITPMAVPSRRSGTPSMVRTLNLSRSISV